MRSSIVTLSAEHFQRLRASGRPLTLVDVRTLAEYRSGHAEGALSLPLDELTPATLAERTGQPDLGQARPLYLLCASGARAREAAERLARAGLTRLTLIEGGTDAWSRAGLPMRRCGRILPLERQVQIAVGSLLVLKVIFGFTVHELFFGAVALIGAGLITAGLTRWCGMARLLARMPWNQGGCPGDVPA